jgi:hypothetical protein
MEGSFGEMIAGLRGWMRNQGFPSHVFDERPVIGICNTWPELAPASAAQY